MEYCCCLWERGSNFTERKIYKKEKEKRKKEFKKERKKKRKKERKKKRKKEKESIIHLKKNIFFNRRQKKK